MTKLRPFGELLLELEEVLDEMIDSHGLEWGDVLNLVYGHLRIHRPDAQEQYTEGGTPLFYYGSDLTLKEKKK